MNKFILFIVTETECCCFFLKDYNVKSDITIRPILCSSPPVRLQIFLRTLAINACTFKESMV